MTNYPAELPCPQIDGYTVDISAGLGAVIFEHGNTRQRRYVSEERTMVTMTFVFSTRQLWEWQQWANQYGFAWHDMKLFTQFSGYTAGKTMVMHRLRYIGDISIVPNEADYFSVSLTVELDINYAVEGQVDRTNIWIIARTPANPSTPDWYLAGTPSNPSFYSVIAGYPSFPAA